MTAMASAGAAAEATDRKIEEPRKNASALFMCALALEILRNTHFDICAPPNTPAVILRSAATKDLETNLRRYHRSPDPQRDGQTRTGSRL